MMLMLAVVAVAFFYGTFQNYNALMKTISHEDREIGLAIDSAIRINDDIGFADWYVRSELESRALSERQRQYSSAAAVPPLDSNDGSRGARRGCSPSQAREQRRRRNVQLMFMWPVPVATTHVQTSRACCSTRRGASLTCFNAPWRRRIP